jgi:hypothetical protein
MPCLQTLELAPSSRKRDNDMSKSRFVFEYDGGWKCSICGTFWMWPDPRGVYNRDGEQPCEHVELVELPGDRSVPAYFESKWFAYKAEHLAAANRDQCDDCRMVVRAENLPTCVPCAQQRLARAAEVMLV